VPALYEAPVSRVVSRSAKRDREYLRTCVFLASRAELPEPCQKLRSGKPFYARFLEIIVVGPNSRSGLKPQCEKIYIIRITTSNAPFRLRYAFLIALTLYNRDGK